MNNYTVGKLYIRKYFGYKIVFVVLAVGTGGMRIKILKNYGFILFGNSGVISVDKRSMKVA